MEFCPHCNPCTHTGNGCREPYGDDGVAWPYGSPPLRGKNIGCWCKIGEPCHGDVLLEIANFPGNLKGK